MVMFATVARCRFSEMTSRRSWSSCSSSSSSKVERKSSFVPFVCGLSKNDSKLLLLLCSPSPLLKMSSERGTYACEDSLFISFSFPLSLSLSSPLGAFSSTYLWRFFLSALCNKCDVNAVTLNAGLLFLNVSLR